MRSGKGCDGMAAPWRFRSGWDLYADWAERIPAVAQPRGAWRRTADDAYQRRYILGRDGFTFHYLGSLILVNPE